MLVVAACGGGGSDSDGEADRNGGAKAGGEVLDKPRWRRVVTGPVASDAEPVTGGSVTVALESEVNSFLPSAFRAGRDTFNVIFSIFDPLMARDADGELRPYLAESLQSNDDFTEWTLTLRPEVRFHDGTPLDAQALKRIFDDYLTAEGTATRTALEPVERFEVVDDLTVRYVMTEPTPSFPELLQLPVGWPFSPDAADRLRDAFGERPVGTGPYKFVSWQRGGDLVLERNPDYWQEGRPYLDRITFRPIPDEATRAASLGSGDVDAVRAGGLSSFVADVADIEGVEVVLGSSNRGAGVYFNAAMPPTDDLRIRQALAHAVDQEVLVEVAAGDAAELTEARTQFFPQGSRFYSEEVAEAWLEHDPDRARELYEAYVADPDRSDGKEVGEPVSLTLNALNQPANRELAEAYRGFYEDVGFEVTVQAMEQPELVSAGLDSRFQVQLTPGVGDNRSPFGEFQFYFGNPDDVVTNFTDFHDDTVVEVLERLRTADAEEQIELTERMGLHLARQVPFQWIGSELALIAAKDNVEGLRSWTFPDGTLGNGVAAGVTFWGQVWLTE